LNTILTLQNLSKNYGSIKAVNNLSFTLKKGNIYGVLGPNGSGKSTTLGIILNVINKTSGKFAWFDGSISTHQALKKIGALLEHPNFYPYMTAYQNLKLVCKIKNISEASIDEQLKIVQLYQRKNSKFKTFSLGMKQRLAIASALLNNPEILILDEPTNGLDPQGIFEIREIVKKIANKGTTILLASHLLDEVEKVCSHVIVIKNGVKLFEGKVDDMIASTAYFELNTSSQNDELIVFLTNQKEIISIKKENELVIAKFKKDISATELNKLLFKNKIIVSHLIKRKPSLEEQFLNLTNNVPHD